MERNFLENINELYDILSESIDIAYKIISIQKYKHKLNVGTNDSFTRLYGELKAKDKEAGSVYTPIEIANYIIKNTITIESIIENPFMKILDPACGTGNILIPCYMYLKNMYEENLERINNMNRHKLTLTKDSIGKHIIDNNLLGFDIDELAIKILNIDLAYMSGYVNIEKFVVKDFLIDDIEDKFDIIIGNPPYIGHKSVDREYSKTLKIMYDKIYSDKGDISYCFFKKGIDTLADKGRLTYVTSRYFIESPSGKSLRNLFLNSCSINRIVDFYGIRPFKGIGIDPAIIFLSNNFNNGANIEVIKPKNDVINGKSMKNMFFLDDKNKCEAFCIDREGMDSETWVLVNKREMKVLNKIKEKCDYKLSEICTSFQGIITGCDKAFIIDEQIMEVQRIEPSIVKPWIKSTYINKQNIVFGGKYLIYSDLIDDVENFPGCLKRLQQYKEKLMGRRECVKGIRLWYELQWGRTMDLFEGTKIIFPYKASSNKFALDKGSYFSADIYALLLKENTEVSYEFLLFILNSRLYEYYFKSFAKKLGDNMYEYYPNNIMKLRIPKMEHIVEYNDLSLYKYFNLSEEEIKIVEDKIV